MNLPEQLSLSISLQDDATFSNFWVSPSNQIPLKALSLFCQGEGDLSLLLWGFGGCGLTHLLQACSHQSRLPVAYLPLKDALDLDPNDVCANLERASLVCVDDIETLAGNAQWELAFFHLYNRLRDNGHRLLMASHTNPAAIPLALPDLHSRLLGSVVYRVDNLSQEEKIDALQMRAKVRGIKISADVARFIIKRAPKRMKKMFTILEQLDGASLRLQKKLSVRLAKQILDDDA
ncbi:DnaA regulatory inactivator Hda [Marinagarivorans algicola]|uniref:DnaA regulatory inactivator Hda n=1 Tax=Marinagarivorans algicola TaxID=1513270 RepID=UPI0006B51ED8|nr:DnaA regulatory inactivator Hda [Marinagarivorans algicola]